MGMSELQFQERKNMSQQERGRHFEPPQRITSKLVLFLGIKLMPWKEQGRKRRCFSERMQNYGDYMEDYGNRS